MSTKLWLLNGKADRQRAQNVALAVCKGKNMRNFLVLFSDDLNKGWNYSILSALDMKNAYEQFTKTNKCLYSRIFEIQQDSPVK